jgi:hypothetical protein
MKGALIEGGLIVIGRRAFGSTGGAAVAGVSAGAPA